MHVLDSRPARPPGRDVDCLVTIYACTYVRAHVLCETYAIQHACAHAQRMRKLEQERSEGQLAMGAVNLTMAIECWPWRPYDRRTCICGCASRNDVDDGSGIEFAFRAIRGFNNLDTSMHATTCTYVHNRTRFAGRGWRQSPPHLRVAESHTAVSAALASSAQPSRSHMQLQHVSQSADARGVIELRRAGSCSRTRG
jgi:hypothetical protein